MPICTHRTPCFVETALNKHSFSYSLMLVQPQNHVKSQFFLVHFAKPKIHKDDDLSTIPSSGT